jgi:aryl-alcohol dehydrogenase-like predicted oxidoreductase
LGSASSPIAPLGRGFLTGAVKADTTFDPSDFRNTQPRFASDVREQNLRFVGAFADIAARKAITPAQLALAWLLAQKPWIVPIPGTRKRARLEENIGALQTALTAEDLGAISASVKAHEVAGERYTGQGLGLVNR